jgi:hypothetical protein
LEGKICKDQQEKAEENKTKGEGYRREKGRTEKGQNIGRKGMRRVNIVAKKEKKNILILKRFGF